IHALEVVGKDEKRGRGKKGGLSEYAEMLGKTKQYISQLVQPAEVAKVSSQLDTLSQLSDKAQHLVAVHALPESIWSEAVQHLLAKELSVGDMEGAAKQARKALAESAEVPDSWKEYLPAERCALAVFRGEDPNAFKRLLSRAEEFYERLKEHED